MGLQIRVRHALGERVMELPDRTVEKPLVVGRSTTADVQLPSATVGSKHCALFLHEGRWVVQDLKAGGVFVNNKPVKRASLLQIGDVVRVGQDGDAPTIEIEPAAAAEGRTGYAGGGRSQQSPVKAVTPAHGGYTAAPAAHAGYAPGYAPHPGQAAPYAGPPLPHVGMTPPSPQAYSAPVPQATDEYAGYESAEPSDEISYEPAANYTPRYSARRKKSGSGGMIMVMIVTTVLVGGVVGWAIMQAKEHQQKQAVKPPDRIITIPATTVPAKPKPLFSEASGGGDTALDSTGKPGTMPANAAVVEPRKDAGDGEPSTSAPPRKLEPATVIPGPPPARSTEKSPTESEGMDPIRKPTAGGSGEGMDPIRKPAAGGTEEGMDPIRKPTAGGSEEGMDPIRKPAAGGAEEGMDPIRKPAEPAKPTGPDAETLDPAMASSWEMMQQLAETPGKESFAVLRFEDFKRLNPGKHDAEIDEFIDRKMDRIWWERVDQLFRKLDKFKSEIDKTQLEVFDENNMDVKKQKIESIKKMKTDLEDSNKLLRETMGYAEADPPNLSNSAELAALAKTRDKNKYEGWKKATIYYIKNNQGKLQWANEI